MNTVPRIISMAVLILLSAYFSATETAFSSLNKTKLKLMNEDGKKGSKLALSLLEKYDKLISTVLIGNNIVNIALASIGTVFFVDLLGEGKGATVSTAVITVAVLIFGEITPKSIAKDIPEKYACFVAPFIQFLIWVFTPLNFIFTLLKKFIAKIFGIEADRKLSQEELLMLVDEVQQDGSIDTDEGSLLKNVIEFNEIRAVDILTHRVDLEAVSVDTSKEEIAEAFTQSKFSRILVFEDTIDTIVGVIHQKDFYCGMGVTEKSVKEIMTEPIFVPKTECVDDLLKLLQKAKSHVAVVLDEYGGTLGIVTMEDILEEIVGDIWDEHDEVVETYQKLGDNHFSVDCSESLDDFCEFFDIEIEDAESVSLGGWIMEQLNKAPEEGDTFEYANIKVSVAETDGQRIVRADVLQQEKESEEE